MESAVLSQHRLLDSLFGEVRAAFRRDPLAVGAAVARLAESLEAHFDQEDRLYYPAIWALRPEQKPRLEACVGAHEWFRARLRDVAEHLERDDPREAARTFDQLAEAFAQHEAAEEDVLSELERELIAGR